MSKTKRQQKVRLYLTVDKGFFNQLKELSSADYMKVTSWTQQFLMRALHYNKPEVKPLKTNGNM
jgi:hypothetical protein